jgi:hypothetical protein
MGKSKSTLMRFHGIYADKILIGRGLKLSGQLPYWDVEVNLAGIEIRYQHWRNSSPFRQRFRGHCLRSLFAQLGIWPRGSDSRSHCTGYQWICRALLLQIPGIRLPDCGLNSALEI